LAPAIGPYIGGVLTDTVGWQWNFYINFIPGILMFIAVFVAIVPEPLDLKLLKQCDWVGIATMAVGLGSLIAMLEQGQQDDWFGSAFIRTCGLLAGVFISVFIVWELFVSKTPLVHLRLMASRNLGLSSVIGFVLGVGLYGTIYLIPLYLGDVQDYSPRQIGEVLVWVGLPQLLVFPFLPLLQKKFDVRMLIFLGSLLFAGSCFMNSYMSLDYGKDQFMLSNIVRALGQPFTIVPVTGLAMATISRKDAGEASALFNMFRNLGGSVGIAMLSTLVTRREQFHDTRIGERITAYGLALQDRIATSQARFIVNGFDPVTAKQQAYGALQAVVQRQASIMSFNDAFLIVGFCLIVGSIIVWFCKRPVQVAAAVG
jgi:DHA2 family multidrug resistance protein